MTYHAIIRTPADLERMWRTLIGPLGFGGHSLWLTVLECDGRTTPVITEITDVVSVPGASDRSHLGGVVRLLVEELVPGGRAAFLRTRPGRDGVSDDDRAWAAALYAVSRETGAPVEVVHVANDVMLAPVPTDGLRLVG